MTGAGGWHASAPAVGARCWWTWLILLVMVAAALPDAEAASGVEPAAWAEEQTPAAAASWIRVEERFDLRNAEVDALIATPSYEVDTVYGGELARTLRERFQSTSEQDIGDGYLGAVGVFYAGMAQTAPPALFETARVDEVLVRERYRWPQAWQPASDGGDGFEAVFFLGEVHRELFDPKLPAAGEDLPLPFPYRVDERVEVLLDSGWPTDSGEFSVDTGYFRLQVSHRLDARRMQMTGSFETLAAAVPAAEIDAHLAALAEGRAQTAQSLTVEGSETAFLLDPPTGELHSDGWQLWMSLAAAAALLLLPFLTLLHRGHRPMLSMWMRPRETARQWIGQLPVLATVLLLLGSGVASALIPEDFDHPLIRHGWLVGGLVVLLAGLVAVVMQAPLVWLVGVTGRRYGGSSGLAGLFRASALGAVPAVWSILPILLLLAGFGPLALVDAHPEAALIMLPLFAVVLLFWAWSLVSYVGALAAAQRFGIGAALANLLSVVVVLLLATLVVLFVRALWQSAAAGWF